MADILSFQTQQPEPVNYYVDVTLHPNNLQFTLNRIGTDPKSLLKVAAELEKIASIIRTDVVTNTI